MRMTFGLSRRRRLRPVHLAIAGLFALIMMGGGADARGVGSARAVESIASREAGEPVLAIVSLQKQRITIYDAQGWILRAPVSSGTKGRETPSGIFSVIQKEAEHYSNLYDDAFMPHMQRLTWSGIALHGGPLPGYPASHGCIRMPFDFADRLFDMTQLGLRVIVAPTDVAPVETVHPLLLRAKPDAGDAAAARIAEANDAARKDEQARGAAGRAYRESMQATVPVRVAENLKAKADARLAAVEASLGSASSADAKQEAEDAKAKAAASVAETDAKLAAARDELQSKLDALAAARDAAKAAQVARAAAAAAARQAARELAPISVLISRKTQRLYVRQAFEPIYESPVTIQDADRPIGTHVFTAIERVGGEAGARWNVVSLENGRPRGAEVESPSEPDRAKAALDRIVIPQEALDRIAGMTPRSSVIVTDEASSSETGKGTDFVIVLSDEPQGGIKFRRRRPPAGFGYVRSRERFHYWGSTFRSPLSMW
ncbi:L,D-transpeptidase family protein [Bradyrhizobium lablabi]|uniref:L,D-transpeptidase family protein n=1 Tax=Bradyrhizobium lablabi TaxID=722472 RepID=UPI001BA9F4B8|nr:L,D-transpeptidase family protein [Bradyrhizobium lablabi]MBR0691706.1 L,D-transpeptidase family protein [Bradyrhizobium lablabi]